MAGDSDPNAPWITLAGMLPVAITAALFVFFLGYVPQIAAMETVRWAWPWIPSLDIEFSFWLDGLSLTFALLITGIGTLVMLYAAKYLQGHPHFPRFALYLFLFMLSMLGLVLADNLIALFVFWELTTFTSYLLIGYLHTDPKSRRNALQALLLTAAGGLALLAGFILIGITQGTFELSELNAAGSIAGQPLYLGILFLVLAGAFTKSGSRAEVGDAIVVILVIATIVIVITTGMRGWPRIIGRAAVRWRSEGWLTGRRSKGWFTARRATTGRAARAKWTKLGHCGRAEQAQGQN